MERPRPNEESARRIGPYRLITRLDPPTPPPGRIPCRRFVARSADGDRTVLLSTPLPGANPARFLTEAQAGMPVFGS
ncbi:hypothetical protein [Streptomyces sp. NPDC006551]|uniref:hypothetical protein n=1 Tax=Streptomyces sp. NPDC006551 TaxID=3157178 RepID=UPI0033A0715D